MEKIQLYAYNWHFRKFLTKKWVLLMGWFLGFGCINDAQMPCWLRLCCMLPQSSSPVLYICRWVDSGWAIRDQPNASGGRINEAGLINGLQKRLNCSAFVGLSIWCLSLCLFAATVIGICSEPMNLNASNAEATYIQSTRTQRFLKNPLNPVML